MKQLREWVSDWVNVRKRIFTFDGVPPLSMWQELAEAEQALMKAAEEDEINAVHDRSH